VKLKVAVWGTGVVGTQVIRELVDHPVFELAAVIVHNPAKDGRDAGEIAGIGPIGVTATTDAAAVFAAGGLDAVAYFGPTAEYAAENIANMALALRAGVNVVSTSMTPLVYPPACDEWMTRELTVACEAGNASCFTTGIDPGFANDLFPMTLLGVCGRVDSVRIQELVDYADYTGDYAPMGLGEPMDKQAILEIPEILIFSWGHTIPMIADAIGVTLEKIDTVWEKWATPVPIDFVKGRIEAGNCAAVRFEIRGWYDGEPRIIIEHCNRITNAAAPDWPRPRMVDNDAYRIAIVGSPTIEQETSYRAFTGGDPAGAGCLATGMRAINAIPAVIAAPPALLSPLDLPIIPGRGTIRAASGR
jgi:4-hydroxy-tetrahydrodipicolinate reductase